MTSERAAFIGLDTSKLKISVAIAERERIGEDRFLGQQWSRSWLCCPHFNRTVGISRKGSSTRLGYRLMSNDYRHVELLTGDVRCRRWTTEQKLTIIEQSFEPGETVSSTARRHGVAPNLLYR